MKPPPPRLPAPGQVTASANAVATAASTALPPFFKISMPTFEASGSTDTTAACVYDAGCTSGLARYADREEVSTSVITVSIHRMVPEYYDSCSSTCPKILQVFGNVLLNCNSR